MSSSLVISAADIEGPVAGQLILALNAELANAYPERGATHFGLTPEEVSAGQGAFLIVFDRESGAALGCGALRRLDALTGELKRMYVTPEARGRSIGRTLVAALEETARQLGLRRVVLETGVRQQAAMALYEHTGFERIEPFGEYVGSSTSICYGKDV